MNLQAFTVGPLQENCYLLSDAGQAVLIDPGDEAERLLAALGELELTAVWLTHAHFDHVGALADVLDRFPVPVYLHAADEELLEHAAATQRHTVAADSWSGAEGGGARGDLSLHPRSRARTRRVSRLGGRFRARRGRAFSGLGRPHRPARR